MSGRVYIVKAADQTADIVRYEAILYTLDGVKAKALAERINDDRYNRTRAFVEEARLDEEGEVE